MTAWWSYPTNTTGFGDYIGWMQTVSGDLLGNAILIVTFILSLLALMTTFQSKVENALTASGFLSSIIGILLYRMGMVNIILVYVCIFLTVVGFLWSFSKGSNSGGGI